MIQEIITYVIISICVFYIIYKFSTLIFKKKANPCDNCSGCAIKDIKPKHSLKV